MGNRHKLTTLSIPVTAHEVTSKGQSRVEKHKREVTQATASLQFSISRNCQVSGIRQVATNLVYQPHFMVTRDVHVWGPISPRVPLSSLTQF